MAANGRKVDDEWYKRIKKMLGEEEPAPIPTAPSPLGRAPAHTPASSFRKPSLGPAEGRRPSEFNFETDKNSSDEVTDTTRLVFRDSRRSPSSAALPRVVSETPTIDSGARRRAGSAPDIIPVADPTVAFDSMAMREFLELFGALEVGSFAERFPFPFLLRVSRVEQKKSGSDEQFRTVSMTRGEAGMEWEFLNRVLFPLAKKRSGGFDQMLSVGRAVNNDLVVRSQMVSKFHATFACRKGQWEIVDQGSSNGTFVEKQRLAAKKPVEIGNGSQIGFSGNTNFVFYDAHRLHALVQMLKDRIG